MFRVREFINLLFALVMVTAFLSPTGIYAAEKRETKASPTDLTRPQPGGGVAPLEGKTARSNDNSESLLDSCGGIASPDPNACCIFGYVFYNDESVDGASVYIESSYGTFDTTTTIEWNSNQSYYSADLSSLPLLASFGDVITITVSYNDMISARTWVVQNGSQQVDLGLVDNHQSPNFMFDLSPLKLALGNNADLSIVKTVIPQVAEPGGSITYTIYVTNTGSVDLHTTITDTLPEHTVYSAPPSGTLILPNTPLVWPDIVISPNNVWMETVVVTVGTDYVGLLTNVVEVTSDEGVTGVYTKTSAVENDIPDAEFCPVDLAGKFVKSGSAFEWYEYFGEHSFAPTDTLTLAFSIAPLSGHTLVGMDESGGRNGYALHFYNGIVYDADHGNEFADDIPRAVYDVGAWNTVQADYKFTTHQYMLTVNGVVTGPFPFTFDDTNSVQAFRVNHPSGTGTFAWLDSISIQSEEDHFPLFEANFDDGTVYSASDGTITSLKPPADYAFVSFSAAPLSGTVPLTVTFTINDRVGASGYSWDFGDGGTSNLENPTHMYTQSGIYTVGLTYSGLCGIDTLTRANYITVETNSLAPVADFVGSPLSGSVPLNVTFTDQSSGDVTSWSWNFGDGGTSTDQNPTHTYTAPDDYTVSLVISGPGGTDVLTRTNYITVEAVQPGPVADFVGSPLSGSAPLTVTFTDQSTGNITAWDWNLGDGGISGARHPIHEYTDPAIYTVTLTVSGSGGSDIEIKSNYITVSSAVTPTWAFLLYMDGDNNLHYWFNRALGELQAASANPYVTILAQFDGPGNGDTWRYDIRPGVDDSWYMGELDMDDPQTLSDFIIWARDAYPTDYTYLAVADHGRGTTGIAWDDTSGSDAFITVAELRTALQSATTDGIEPLDVVHYDACLMGMIENAYQIKDYADYLVASENLGWSIFAFNLYTNQVTTDTVPEILATTIVSEYYNALSGYPRTISAMDLGQAITVTSAISTLATSLQNVIDTNRYYVSNARTAAQKFDSQEYYVINDTDEYLDLYDLARLLQQYVPDAEVDFAAQGVMDAVTTFVVAEEHESGYYRDNPYWDLEDAHGVSIYFPDEPGGWGYDDYINHVSFHFTVDGRWDEFLQDYYGAMGTPPGESVDPGLPPMLALSHTVYLPLVLR